MTEHVSKVSNENVTFNTNDKILELYCIRDVKINRFMPPFFAKNREDAIRQVSNIVNYVPSLINKFPADYELYFCGRFQEDTGFISDVEMSENLGILSVYKKDDTVAYDDLKKDIQQQMFTVQNICKEFDDKNALYEKKLRELTVLEYKIKAKYENKNDVDVYPCIPEKSVQKKKSFIDKLFGE